MQIWEVLIAENEAIFVLKSRKLSNGSKGKMVSVSCVMEYLVCIYIGGE